jgi:NTP pyrophosphatase (non-canonical NTP hydrolase)
MRYRICYAGTKMKGVKLKNAVYNNVNVDLIMESIAQWHHDRNLVAGSTDQAQFTKLIEEAGELAGNIARGRDIKDDIGDMIVVLINIAERNNVTVKECLQTAWEDIRHRKGKMVDGVFIKEEDAA